MEAVQPSLHPWDPLQTRARESSHFGKQTLRLSSLEACGHAVYVVLVWTLSDKLRVNSFVSLKIMIADYVLGTWHGKKLYVV